MRAMIVKEFRELVRDHRTLAMLVVMPLVLVSTNTSSFG
jgi:ABC-2 type transport system permease protein